FGLPGLPVHGRYAHLFHQRADMLTAYLMPPVLKLISNASAPHKWMFQVNLVNKPHQLKITRTDRHCLVVQARPGQFENLALTSQRQRMFFINHFFALGPAIRPSAPDKKSFSMANCPIFACRALTSGPVSSCLSLVNTSSALSNNCFFHSVI